LCPQAPNSQSGLADLLDQSHGLATFSRDRRAASRRYLATTIPQGAIVDLGWIRADLRAGQPRRCNTVQDLQPIGP
jgi:hypothetical protein